MRKCSQSGCSREATVAPKIYVPATGHSAEKKHTVNGLVTLPLCAGCLKDVRLGLQDFLTPQLRSALAASARMSGSTIPPDFSRAWVEACPLSTEEYRSLEAGQVSPKLPTIH